MHQSSCNNDDKDQQSELQSNVTTDHSLLPQVTYKHGPIPDGWECLVTMEDITDENYVEYQCYPSLQWRSAKIVESVIEELRQTQFHAYVNRVKQSDCLAELQRLLQSGPPIYVSDPYGLPLNDDDPLTVVSPAITASKTSIDDMTAGIHIDNTVQLQSSNSKNDSTIIQDTHIIQFWYSSDQQYHTAKLLHAVEGLERIQLWEELKLYYIPSQDTSTTTATTDNTNITM